MNYSNIPFSDMGYFLLLLDIALVPDDPNQLELDFTAESSKKEYDRRRYLPDYLSAKAKI